MKIHKVGKLDISCNNLIWALYCTRQTKKAEPMMYYGLQALRIHIAYNGCNISLLQRENRNTNLFLPLTNLTAR